MKAAHVLLVVLLALPALPAGALLEAGEPAAAEPTPSVGYRAFVLVMDGHSFNGRTFPDTPLLEAYLGESMQVVVAVPRTAEFHTFHLHGHPWESEAHGRFIDAVLLQPGEYHRFSAPAGGQGQFAGDWMYHCHVDSHFEGGMWGILRVYPFSLRAEGDLTTGLLLRADRLGEALEGITYEATFDGRPVPLVQAPAPDGGILVRPALAPDASGELVLTAIHPAEGESLIRFELDGQGGLTERRHVGLEHLADLPPEASADMPKDLQALAGL